MIFEALRVIHSYDILHNNIQEENILINDKGEIHIIDFELLIITNNMEQFYENKCELFNLLNHYFLFM
jgi:tRNA A-37 threonylcarbamoyl transferase component Bud32